MQFEFYVLNYDINARRVEMFNIFQNSIVQKETEKEIKKYLRAPSAYKTEDSRALIRARINGAHEASQKTLTGFQALCTRIKDIIRFEESFRCEYEIGVSSLFAKSTEETERWDCYEQAEPNIEAIVRECIYQYKQQSRKAKYNSTTSEHA